MRYIICKKCSNADENFGNGQITGIFGLLQIAAKLLQVVGINMNNIYDGLKNVSCYGHIRSLVFIFFLCINLV